jgi:hypothetical protein
MRTAAMKERWLIMTSCVLQTQESHLVASLPTCYQQVVFYTHKNHILLQVCQHVTNKLCFTHTRITSCCKSAIMLPTSCVCTAIKMSQVVNKLVVPTSPVQSWYTIILLYNLVLSTLWYVYHDCCRLVRTTLQHVWW